MADKIINSFDVWITAQGLKSRTRLRSVDNISLEGVTRLRELILDLAIRGKLIAQDQKDEPAKVLLKRIATERERLLKEGKLRKLPPVNEVDDGEVTYELPNGWAWTRNSFLFALRKGKKPKLLSNEIIGLPYLDIAALDRNQIVQYTDDLTCPTASEDDILVVCDGSRSGLLLNGKLGVVGSTLAVIDTVPFLKEYLKVLFANAFNELNSTMKGAAIPHLDTNKLLNSIVALPPLAEQHRIVAKVDELMALCDELEKQETHHLKSHQLLVETLLGTLSQASNAAELQTAWSRLAQHFDDIFTTEDSIDQLKQTILQLAVIGKLVPQDPNDEPASELLKEIFTIKGKLINDRLIRKEKLDLKHQTLDDPNLPRGWKMAYMQDITSVITCGIASTPKYTKTGKIFLSAKNVKPYKFQPEEHSFVDEKTYKKIISNGAKPEKGDVLLTRVGAGIGDAAVVDQDIDFAYYVSLTLIKPIKPLINSMFLLHWINSPIGVNSALSNVYGKGVSQGNLNVNQVRKFELAIPPLKEQERIVSKIDHLFVFCDQLKERITEAQKVVNQMAEAVLDQVGASKTPEYNLRGGVLIIGSLFWQDDLDSTRKDGLRKKWRNERLDMSKATKVSVPIRYGRFSGSAKKGNQTYTMIFDRELPKERFGTGMVVPLKNNPHNWSELNFEVKKLSSAEGEGSEFIKWATEKNEAWCICAICFNPKADEQTKTDILKKWEHTLKENKDGHLYFAKAPNKFNLNIRGELEISWPTEAEGLDYLIATSTQPRNRAGVSKLTIQEIADHVSNRDYFKHNLDNEISTYQDNDILTALGVTEQQQP